MNKETLSSRLIAGIGELNTQTNMYGDTNISVKTLSSLVDAFYPSVAENDNVSDETIAQFVNAVKSVGGQIRHQNSEFAKNYKPVEKKTKEDIATTAGNEEIQNLKNELESLKTKLTEADKKNLSDSVRITVKGKSETLKVQNKALWDDAVAMCKFEDGMDESKFTDAVKKVYESKLKSYFGDGATPYGGEKALGNKADAESAKAKREAFKKRMENAGRLPSAENGK